MDTKTHNKTMGSVLALSLIFAVVISSMVLSANAVVSIDDNITAQQFIDAEVADFNLSNALSWDNTINNELYSFEVYNHVVFNESGVYAIIIEDETDSGEMIIVNYYNSTHYTYGFYDIILGIQNTTAVASYEADKLGYAKIVYDGTDVTFKVYGHPETIKTIGSNTGNLTEIRYGSFNMTGSTGYAHFRFVERVSGDASATLEELLPLIITIAVLSMVVGLIATYKYRD